MFRPFNLILLALGMTACEPKFAGDKHVNIVGLNAPMHMKVITPGTTTYLAVMNTNQFNQFANSSLQFFDISTATNPVRVAAMDLQLPTQSGDFLYDAPNLYVLDRSGVQLLVYEYSGGVFIEKLDAGGGAIRIPLVANPQRIIKANTTSNGSVYAILCQSAATILFMKVGGSGTAASDYTFVPSTASFGTTNISIFTSRAGAGFYLAPRQTVANVDDRLVIPGDDAGAYGINNLEFLGDANDTFVTVSRRSPVVFNYRLKTLENSSNLAWDLSKFRDGYTESGVNYSGSKSYGFTGMAKDTAGNIFIASRADDKLYRVSSTEITADKSSAGSTGRNTQGFGEGSQSHVLDITPAFDTDRTDTTFPQLGNMVTDCPGTNCSANSNKATLLWVLGYASNKVYRVAFTSDTTATMTSSAAILGGPQQIYWYEAGGVLYIANSVQNTISVLDATTLN